MAVMVPLNDKLGQFFFPPEALPADSEALPAAIEVVPAVFEAL